MQYLGVQLLRWSANHRLQLVHASLEAINGLLGVFQAPPQELLRGTLAVPQGDHLSLLRIRSHGMWGINPMLLCFEVFLLVLIFLEFVYFLILKCCRILVRFTAVFVCFGCVCFGCLFVLCSAVVCRLFGGPFCLLRCCPFDHYGPF